MEDDTDTAATDHARACPGSQRRVLHFHQDNTTMNHITRTTASHLPVPTAGLLPTIAEPTVRDVDLAERLGYERPANIRNLIKRHLPTLEAMGSLLQREAMIETAKTARRVITEYHLNRAQAAFIVAKAGTKVADSLTVKMAEVFALFSQGRLVAVDETSAEEIAAIEARDRVRRRLIHEEEREARDMGFALLRSGGSRRKRRIARVR